MVVADDRRGGTATLTVVLTTMAAASFRASVSNTQANTSLLTNSPVPSVFGQLGAPLNAVDISKRCFCLDLFYLALPLIIFACNCFLPPTGLLGLRIPLFFFRVARALGPFDLFSARQNAYVKYSFLCSTNAYVIIQFSIF